VSEEFSIGAVLKHLENTGSGSLRVSSSPELLYSILTLSKGRLGRLDEEQGTSFLNVISTLTRFDNNFDYSKLGIHCGWEER